MAQVTLNNVGSTVGQLETGFEPHYPHVNEGNRGYELFIINRADAIVSGSVTVTINYVDGTGAAATLPAGVTSPVVLTLPEPVRPNGFINLGVVNVPATIVDQAADTDNRFYTVDVETALTTAHGTSAQDGEVINIAWA